MSRVVLFIALRQLWDRKLLNSIAVARRDAGRAHARSASTGSCRASR